MTRQRKVLLTLIPLTMILAYIAFALIIRHAAKYGAAEQQAIVDRQAAP